MILSPAHVLPACARITMGNAAFTFHHVSTPIRGNLPVYAYEVEGRWLLPRRRNV